MNKLSIIIPIFNEADTINRLLLFLKKSVSESHVCETIVVDGGSTDGSQQAVAKHTDVVLLNAPKGRAKQMNAGAKIAKGDILYFLHCDSFPPKDFDFLILESLANGNLAGCFRMKFDYAHPVLLVSQWFTRFNHISCRGGDQSLFIQKKLFEKLKGFNENYIIYEDNEIIKRLYLENQFVVIPKYITTSARRYRINGVWCLQYHFAVIHLKKWLGASPDKLLSYYKKYVH